MTRRCCLALTGFALILAACTPQPIPAVTTQAPTRTPIDVTATTETPTLEASEPEPMPQAASQTPSLGGEMVSPTLLELLPWEGSPGATVTVLGSGGYIALDGGGYNESARGFTLTFDGAPVGTLQCYVNRCEGEIVIPADAAPGEHIIATEGGSRLTLRVI